jgi:hypothetical protein
MLSAKRTKKPWSKVRRNFEEEKNIKGTVQHQDGMPMLRGV